MFVKTLPIFLSTKHYRQLFLRMKIHFEAATARVVQLQRSPEDYKQPLLR